MPCTGHKLHSTYTRMCVQHFPFSKDKFQFFRKRMFLLVFLINREIASMRVEIVLLFLGTNSVYTTDSSRSQSGSQRMSNAHAQIWTCDTNFMHTKMEEEKIAASGDNLFSLTFSSFRNENCIVAGSQLIRLAPGTCVRTSITYEIEFHLHRNTWNSYNIHALLSLEPHFTFIACICLVRSFLSLCPERNIRTI